MKFQPILYFALFCFVVSFHLQCNKGEVDFYRYSSKVTGVGTNKEIMKVRADLGVTCTGVIQENGQDLLVQVLEVVKIKLSHDGEHPGSEEGTTEYQEPITFFQKRNGEITKVIFDKKENPQTVSLKKSMVSLFQVRIGGSTVVEQTQAGSIKYLYEKAVDEEGNEILHKKALELLQAGDKRMKKKDCRIKQDCYIKIENDGKLHDVFCRDAANVGQPSKRQHDMYENEKKQVTESEQHPRDFKDNENAKNSFNFGSVQRLMFLRSGEYTEKDGKVKLEETNTLGISEKYSVHDSASTGTLAVDDALMQQLENDARERIQSVTDFPELLQKISENPQDQNLLAKAHEYVSLTGEETLPILSQQYDILNLDNPKDLDYALSIQSLFTAVQTEKAQEQLIRTFGHHNTLQQAIANTLALNTPSDKVVDILKTLSTQAKFEGIHEDSQDDIRTNAYLAYAHCASKLSGEKATEILNHVTDKLAKSEDVREFEMNVHALANMGEHIPLEGMKVLAHNEGLPMEVRVASIKGLINRNSDHEDITTLLHELVESHHNEGIRVAAVNTLKEREGEFQDGASVEYLRNHYEHPETPVSVLHSIKDYMLEVQSERSHNILDSSVDSYFKNEFLDSDETEDEHNTLILRRIKRGLKRVGGKIKRGLKRVGGKLKKAGQAIAKGAKKFGKAVVKVAKKAYDATIGRIVGVVKNFIKKIRQKFSKAKFKGERVCTQVSQGGTQMCMYDSDMVAFIRRQGDLSQMKWARQFSWETLVGVEIMHVYFGAMGYAGTRIDCARNEFDVAVFGRAEAKGKLFGRNVPVIALELELQKRTHSNLHDRAYLRIFKAVLFNRQFVPERVRRVINSCERLARPLMKPFRRTLLQFTFQIVVVVVPLKFQISVTGELGVELVNIVCPGRLTLTAAVEPYVEVGISAYGAIGFKLLSGGVRVDYTASYRLIPQIGTSNCNLCAILRQEVRPVTISIHLQAKAFTKTWSVQLYRFNGPVIKKELFRRCLFPNRAYDPEGVMNGPEPEAPSQLPQLPSGRPNRPGRPSGRPNRPNGRPTKRPNGRPNRPNGRPNGRPTKRPNRPNGRPNGRPTKRPNGRPNGRPTKRPNRPNGRPTKRPNGRPKRPNGRPNRPNGRPSKRPKRPNGRPKRPNGRPSGNQENSNGEENQEPQQPENVSQEPQEQPAPQETPQEQPASQESQEQSESNETVQRQTQRPVQRPVQRPRPTQRPVQRPIQRPVQRPIQRPIQRPVQRPIQRPQPVFRPQQPQFISRPQPVFRPQQPQPVYRPQQPFTPRPQPTFAQQPFTPSPYIPQPRLELPPVEPMPIFRPRLAEMMATQQPQYIQRPQQQQQQFFDRPQPMSQPQYVPRPQEQFFDRPQPMYQSYQENSFPPLNTVPVREQVPPQIPMPYFGNNQQENPVFPPLNTVEVEEEVPPQIPMPDFGDDEEQQEPSNKPQPSTKKMSRELSNIRQTLSKCLPNFKKQVAHKKRCCQQRKSCCSREIVHPETGKNFRHFIRKLQRRTRRLFRKIERRNQQRRRFERQDNLSRRLFDQLSNEI